MSAGPSGGVALLARLRKETNLSMARCMPLPYTHTHRHTTALLMRVTISLCVCGCCSVWVAVYGRPWGCRCKEALAATGGADYASALAWLAARETELGQAKAAKVEGRTATDGAVALFRTSPAAACLVEVQARIRGLGIGDVEGARLFLCICVRLCAPLSVLLCACSLCLSVSVCHRRVVCAR
jgi:hypothetical protein